MMDVLQRFLTYVSYDTQSAEDSDTFPSTAKQLALGGHLCAELQEMGLEARRDEWGYVYALLPATPGCEGATPLGFIAHMDTSPDAPGANAKPRIVAFSGADIVLNEKENVILSPTSFPSLWNYLGQELVVTDGTTLLGADDKAGVAEIVSAAAYLLQHPEIAHGPLWLAFTPDEEIGAGVAHFDLEHFGAKYAYTVDGGELGELEFENFNAANAGVLFRGQNIHPGEGKDKMVNAALMACEFVSLLPPAEAPAHTEGREGFFHVCDIKGDETKAMVSLLVRDHDRQKFEERKELLRTIVDYLNQRYGPGRAELRIRDMYYNMRAKIEPKHMDLIRRAGDAFRAVGVKPKIVPIRGGTDGARLSYMGLPCPNLSTGGVNFHGVHEYLPVASLRKMVEVLVELARAENWM